MQVKVKTYPEKGQPEKHIIKQVGGRFALPHGPVPPAPFEENIEGSAYDCLDYILGYFFASKNQSEIEEHTFNQWKEFHDNFPRNEAENAHVLWAETHPEH
jgi:hypothetical protein